MLKEIPPKAQLLGQFGTQPTQPELQQRSQPHLNPHPPPPGHPLHCLMICWFTCLNIIVHY